MSEYIKIPLYSEYPPNYAIVKKSWFDDAMSKYERDTVIHVVDFIYCGGVHMCHSLEESALCISGSKYYIVNGIKVEKEVWAKLSYNIKFDKKIKGLLDGND